MLYHRLKSGNLLIHKIPLAYGGNPTRGYYNARFTANGHALDISYVFRDKCLEDNTNGARTVCEAAARDYLTRHTA